MAHIGITTTVPVEVILAAVHVPVDLNNIFIQDRNAGRLIEEAEDAGYPRNICGWIKGLYSVTGDSGSIDKVIAVTQGDCSNTHALMETLQLAGIETIPFAFPYDRDYDLLKLQMDKLIEFSRRPPAAGSLVHGGGVVSCHNFTISRAISAFKTEVAQC
jgi:benzoyl-CoA reductase/2-hydroxyglutaryl-CoA dehydratase subunit BcrC/BadD/HgdB